MITRCPNCSVRIVTDPHNSDVIHQCNSGDPTRDNEDVTRIGQWEDFSGSGANTPQDDMRRGAENDLFGTTADIEGDKNHEKTRRGAIASTHRQRQHFEFINIENKGLD